MTAPETKDESSAKNMEANSAAAPTEKTVAKKGRPRKPRVLARQRQNNEGRGYAMTSGKIKAKSCGPDIVIFARQ
jgi:hypothetical protein